MKNKKYIVKDRIISLMFKIALLFPFIIVIKYFIGYRISVYVDALLTLVLFIHIIVLKTIKEKPVKLYYSMLIIFLVILLCGTILPGFEYLGKIKTIYAELLYIIPSIIYVSLYIYYYKKGYISLLD